MTRILPLTVILIAVLCLACGDDGTTPRVEPEPTIEGTGEINPGAGDFDITIDLASTPDGPVPGPFVLHGSNIHYDDAVGALAVDLNVTNAGNLFHPLPASLTFVRLLPSGTGIMNADDHTEDGPRVDLHFLNADAQWEPGETSVPREVQFLVDPGTAVGFAVRVSVGMPPTGAIAGVVWDNYAGDDDHGEYYVGLADVTITLREDVAPEAGFTDKGFVREATTDLKGRFRFDDVPAGAYVVTRVHPPGDVYAPAPGSPPELHVVLPIHEDGVPDFLEADFASVFTVENGDFLETTGYYTLGPTTGSTAASTSPNYVAVTARKVDCTPPPEACENCPCGDGVLQTVCGTIHWADETEFQVLGARFHYPDFPPDPPWKAGDRVCVEFVDEDNTRQVLSIAPYDGADAVVKGTVSEFFRPAGSNLFICGGVITCIGYCPPPPE